MSYSGSKNAGLLFQGMCSLCCLPFLPLPPPGPFLQLDAEAVEEDVGNMWRMMHKLSRTFSDLPNPKRSTENFKIKLNNFKEHLPLVQTFCNPGIRDRHWKKVG